MPADAAQLSLLDAPAGVALAAGSAEDGRGRPAPTSAPPAGALGGGCAGPPLDSQEEADESVVEAPPTVEIRVSARRRKTIDAYWERNTIVVVVPQRLSKRDRQVYADELAAKLLAARDRTRPSDEALLQRALALSDRYLEGDAQPSAVRWSARQRTRWGSCTPADRTIRISARLKGVPGWVLDAVLVHELAHLLRAEHDATFYELVARYPRTADADVFLAGYHLGLQQPQSP